MFSYYGSKSKIVHLYPPPKYGTIIEPFAGSARYSLKYFDREVILVDKYDVIVNTWQWLQKCSKADILGLPILKPGQTLDDFSLTKEQKTFLGFIVQAGTTGMRKTVSDRGYSYMKTQLKFICSQLFKIKHWQIFQNDYANLMNQPATWFIDPPYQFGGHEYKFSNKQIDFNHLRGWCMQRDGQIIICENTKADWLPFQPVTRMSGSIFATTEAIWTNLPSSFNTVQQSLFKP